MRAAASTADLRFVILCSCVYGFVCLGLWVCGFVGLYVSGVLGFTLVGCWVLRLWGWGLRESMGVRVYRFCVVDCVCVCVCVCESARLVWFSFFV